MSKITAACHNHTVLCDGKNTPEEMAAAAYAKGFTDFGFSGHSRTPSKKGVPPYGVQDEDAYIARLITLKQQYAGKMNIAIGLEQDFYAPLAHPEKWDYFLCAVHEFYDTATGKIYFVDGSKEMLQACKAEMFGGDGMAMVQAFYDLTVQNVQTYHPHIIAHFDLIVKNNADGSFFDENSAAYQKIALEALEKCAQTGAIFELNTGGIFRGYRASPYPADFLLTALRDLGARIMINADAHCTEAVDFWFNEAVNLLKKLHIPAVTVLENGQFIDKVL